jgi:prophage regulatory protein
MTDFPDRLLRMPDVLPLIGCRPAWLYRMVQRGLFPRPVKLTPTGRAAAWRQSEVFAWIADRPRAGEQEQAEKPRTRAAAARQASPKLSSK